MNAMLANPVNRHFPANRGLKWWLLGGPRGRRLADLASGYHADVATADDKPGLGRGPFGRSDGLDFNATDQSATVAYKAALLPAAASTWFCWVRPRTFPGIGNLYVASLWGNETNATPSARWGIGTTSAAGDAARVGLAFTAAGPVTTEVASGTDLDADEWTWVGVTTDGADATFYYMGSVESTTPFTPVPQASTDDWRVGAAAVAGGAALEKRFDGLAADMHYHPTVCLDAKTMRLAFDDSRRRFRRALRLAGGLQFGASLPPTPPPPLALSFTNTTGVQQRSRNRVDGRDDLLAQRVYQR